MKKIVLILISFVIIPFAVYAQAYEETPWADTDSSASSSPETKAQKAETQEPAYNHDEDDDEDKEKEVKSDSGKNKGLNKRSFELSIANLKIGFGNDFLTSSQIFQETMVLNIDELKDGLNMNILGFVNPLAINIYRDTWGFGLNTRADIYGNIGLSGNTLSFKKAVNEKSDLNAAVFAEIGLNGYFTISNFKIKVKPSVFYPIAYIKSDISYTNSEKFILSYDVQLFTAWDLDASAFELTASPGFDFYLGAEYPLAKVIGLADKIPLLDFGIGIDLYNIRIVRADLNNYTRYSGRIGKEDPISLDLNSDDQGLDSLFDDFFSIDDSVSGEETISVARPFRLQVWADWRPLFGTQFLTIFPMVGFSINSLYNDVFSMEFGVRARMNLANLFLAEFGIKREDRMWQNSLGIAFNFRAFELDLGVDMRAPSFTKSWSGGGFGVMFGLKFGW